MVLPLQKPTMRQRIPLQHSNGRRQSCAIEGVLQGAHVVSYGMTGPRVSVWQEDAEKKEERERERERANAA